MYVLFYNDNPYKEYTSIPTNISLPDKRTISNFAAMSHADRANFGFYQILPYTGVVSEYNTINTRVLTTSGIYVTEEITTNTINLAAYKTLKLQQLKNIRDAQFNTTYTYNSEIYEFTNQAVSNISEELTRINTLARLNQTLPTNIVWLTNDGSPITFTINQFYGFALAMTNRKRNIYQTYSNKATDILNQVTITGIYQYDIMTGW